MPEDNRHQAVGANDTPHLRECAGNASVVVLSISMLAGRLTVLLDYDLVCLVLKALDVGCDGHFRSRCAQSTLQPNKEEIRRVSVVDHRVVRRVRDYSGYPRVPIG